MNGDPEYGPQLRLEEVEFPQTEADTAEPQKRVFLGGDKPGNARELVRPKVEGADHQGACGAERGRDLEVRIVVFGLGWVGGFVQVEELGPIQANPFRAPLQTLTGLGRELDIPKQPDGDFVVSHRWLVPE